MDITALEGICVYVGSGGKISLQKIIMDGQARPFGLYFGLTDIKNGNLHRELKGYGLFESEVTDIINAVTSIGLYQEVIVEKR